MANKSESKYERLRKIGIGSYGVVFKCVNRQTGQIVAIKRYSENDSDPIIRKIAMREVRMLRQLRHPNLINLIEVFRRKRRLHLVFDYCELTVLDVIEKYASNCPLNLIKKIVWQTVNAINYCHTHNCIHRDIKPENILINQSGVVKLCDFGFARTVANKQLISSQPANFSNKLQRESQILDGNNNNKENNNLASDELIGISNSDRQALTEYVATRWYRAPELLIGEVYYDIKIDIWALGCVAAELMRGEPVWPGKTDLDQLCMIKCSLGQLTANQAHTLITQAIYDEANIERLLTLSSNMNEALERKMPARVGQSGIEFVLACLQMDPARRPTSDELLKHHYISSVKMSQFMRDNPTSVGNKLSGSISNLTGVSQPQNLINSTATNGATNGRLNSQSLMLAANSSSQQSSQIRKKFVVTTKSDRSNTSLTSLNSNTLPSLNNNQGQTNGKTSSIPRAVSRASVQMNEEIRPIKQVKQQQPLPQTQPSKLINRKASRTETGLARQRHKQAPYTNRATQYNNS